MKIIISPAKKMRVQTDIIEETGMPVFFRGCKTASRYFKGVFHGAAEEAVRRQ